MDRPRPLEEKRGCLATFPSFVSISKHSFGKNVGEEFNVRTVQLKVDMETTVRAGGYGGGKERSSNETCAKMTRKSPVIEHVVQKGSAALRLGERSACSAATLTTA